MDLYVPILVLAVLAGGFAIFSVAIAPFTGPKRWNRAKLDAYECGIEPTPQPVGGGRFPLKYMVTAMLFIVFDIEIIFLYPWAVSFAPQTDELGRVLSSGLGLFALVEMLLFIVTVLVAYAYVWRRKGLDWD
jgi:NADH-quinone oxidoreductase subunit A